MVIRKCSLLNASDPNLWKPTDRDPSSLRVKSVNPNQYSLPFVVDSSIKVVDSLIKIDAKQRNQKHVSHDQYCESGGPHPLTCDVNPYFEQRIDLMRQYVTRIL